MRCAAGSHYLFRDMLLNKILRAPFFFQKFEVYRVCDLARGFATIDCGGFGRESPRESTDAVARPLPWSDGGAQESICSCRRNSGIFATGPIRTPFLVVSPSADLLERNPSSGVRPITWPRQGGSPVDQSLNWGVCSRWPRTPRSNRHLGLREFHSTLILLHCFWLGC